MHYNTCEHRTVKRDVALADIQQASTGVWASSIVFKTFVFIVIRDRITASIEEGGSFQFCRDMQYYSKLVACSRFSSLSGLGPGRLANEAT